MKSSADSGLKSGTDSAQIRPDLNQIGPKPAMSKFAPPHGDSQIAPIIVRIRAVAFPERTPTRIGATCRARSGGANAGAPEAPGPLCGPHLQGWKARRTGWSRGASKAASLPLQARLLTSPSVAFRRPRPLDRFPSHSVSSWLSHLSLLHSLTSKRLWRRILTIAVRAHARSCQADGTQCHYVRCLKPNPSLRPAVFDTDAMLRRRSPRVASSCMCALPCAHMANAHWS